MSIDVYAIGLCNASVCAPKDAPLKNVEGAANRASPTGLDHGWEKADGPFKTGEPNPCPCNHDPDRLHWLLVC